MLFEDTLTHGNESQNYLKLPAAYGYEIQNSSPTRVTSTTSTCLDLVISCFAIENITVEVTISDHYALQPWTFYIS